MTYKQTTIFVVINEPFFLEIERPPPRLEYPLTGVRKSLGGKGLEVR